MSWKEQKKTISYVLLKRTRSLFILMSETVCNWLWLLFQTIREQMRPVLPPSGVVHVSLQNNLVSPETFCPSNRMTRWCAEVCYVIEPLMLSLNLAKPFFVQMKQTLRSQILLVEVSWRKVQYKTCCSQSQKKAVEKKVEANPPQKKGPTAGSNFSKQCGKIRKKWKYRKRKGLHQCSLLVGHQTWLAGSLLEKYWYENSFEVRFQQKVWTDWIF